MKHVKQTLTLMLALIVLASTMVFPAYAANTSNYNITKFSAPATGYKPIVAQQKTDSSPVYVWIQSSGNSITRVQAIGYLTQSNNGGEFPDQNCTLSNGKLTEYVICKTGEEYLIRTMLYEYEWPWATLAFGSIDQASDVISGVWSPDSKGTYTVATN